MTDAPRDVVVGVDLGTTAVKVVAFRVGTPWRHLVQREYPLLEPGERRQVQDVAAVLDATLTALADAVRAVHGALPGAHVLGLSLSTAMHGVVGVDRAGRALTPLVTWADARATDIARELHASGEAAGLHQVSGTPVHPMAPLTKLLWFRHHEPETWQQVHRWCDLKAVLVHRLTGTSATEVSSASASGLLDRRTGTWSDDALHRCGLTPDRLPDVLPTTAVLPLAVDVAAAVGLPAGTPVVLGAADGPLGNLGTGAMTPDRLGLSLGTSGAVRMVVPEPPEVLDPSLFCYALVPGAWVVGGAVSNGGVVVRWAGSTLVPESSGGPDGVRDEVVLELAARAPAGSDGLVMLPYLLAERGPLWDPTLPGSYLGLRRTHTRAHLVRAAVEGVALQLSTIVDRLARLHPVETVRATGGTLRSDLWCDVLAATLGRPLEVVGAAEGTALGAAALGLHALGAAPDLLAAPAMLGESAVGRVVRPDPAATAVYARNRAAVPGLVAALAPVAALLTEDGAPA